MLVLGSIDDSDRMVHLGNHPDVTMCRPCARWAAKEAREIEGRDRTGPLVNMRDGFRRDAAVVSGGVHQGFG